MTYSVRNINKFILVNSMTNFLKEIFEGKTNEVIHHNFTRYGKGEYERLVFELKSGKALGVKSSWDFSNEFVKLAAEYGRGKLHVSGKIITNYDFKDKVPCNVTDYSKWGALHTAEVEDDLTPEQLKEIYEKFKFHFLLLNMKGDNLKLKVGKGIPKPGKAELKKNFCSATFPLEVKQELAWDVKDFKVLQVKHLLKINEIELDKELMQKDPPKARTAAIRKGVIVRLLDVDGKQEKKEVPFTA